MFYKNLQFCYCKVFLGRREFSISSNARLLMDFFGFSRLEAEDLVRKFKLANKDPDMLAETYQYCKKLGYSNKDILQNKSLLSQQFVATYHHSWALEETGCNPLHPKLLSHANGFINKKLLVFKSEKFLAANINVVDRFLSYLEPQIPVPSRLRDKNMAQIDDMTWKEVHRIVMEEYLKHRLNADTDDMIKLFRIHKMIENKSFRIIQENIKMAESLGLSHAKILRSGYILHNYPEYPKEVLRDFPDLAGLDMRVAMKNNPKLIMISPKKILKIYGILKEFEIPDDSIRSKHQIFTMSPETVKFRLQEITRHPELRVLLHRPRFLELVTNQKKVNARLSFLQKLKLKCASFCLLTTDIDRLFDSHIKEGKDVNRGWDTVLLFSNLLNKDVKEVRKRLCSHPLYQHVPFVNIHDTYNYLASENYNKENIYRVIHILLYPKQKIQKAITQLKHESDISFLTLSQVKQMRLILYYIEKEHHFTGNGIWMPEDSAVAVPEENTLEGQ